MTNAYSTPTADELLDNLGKVRFYGGAERASTVFTDAETRAAMERNREARRNR